MKGSTTTTVSIHAIQLYYSRLIEYRSQSAMYKCYRARSRDVITRLTLTLGLVQLRVYPPAPPKLNLTFDDTPANPPTTPSDTLRSTPNRHFTAPRWRPDAMFATCSVCRQVVVVVVVMRQRLRCRSDRSRREERARYVRRRRHTWALGQCLPMRRQKRAYIGSGTQADWLCVEGVAREVAALYGERPPPVAVYEEKKSYRAKRQNTGPAKKW
jgi:hypothetical protein